MWVFDVLLKLGGNNILLKERRSCPHEKILVIEDEEKFSILSSPILNGKVLLLPWPVPARRPFNGSRAATTLYPRFNAPGYGRGDLMQPGKRIFRCADHHAHRQKFRFFLELIYTVIGAQKYVVPPN